MDVTGKAFPVLLRETVLNKIGMTDSSYEQPLPAARAAQTAIGTYQDGKPVHGKWHLYPEMAAAGLWTTPSDLAKFAIEIAQSRNGKPNKILSQKMVEEMLTPVLHDAGLGFFTQKENPGFFGHNGADEGFQALLTMNWQTGQGAALMANSDNGIAVADLLLRSIAREYGWNYKFEELPPRLRLVAMVRGAQVALDRYAELKKAGALGDQAAENELNRMGYLLLFGGHEQDAIKVFQRNVQDYPESWNVYDSIGEAYMKTGQKDLAIKSYEKSLELNPKSDHGKEMLKRAREMK
jgi:CubicO group peptidase (beta-lactamase class C family)